MSTQFVTVNTDSTEYRRLVSELLAWEIETGVPLPYPAADIAAMELAGNVVDLETGEIYLNERRPMLRARATATVIGEATVVLMGLDGAL